MKEKLYTIDLNDAWKTGDECPLCWLERKLEQETMSFVLGSSYMESDIREETDKTGFCRSHTKQMFDYGNHLGNAWILKTRMQYLNKNLKGQMKNYVPDKRSLMDHFKKSPSGAGGELHSPVGKWIKGQESHCYICGRIANVYERYLSTFVYMVKQDQDFVKLLEGSRGMCIHHFADVLEACENGLSQKEKEQVIPLLYNKMSENLDRIQEDIDWFIEKYDYLNADADWKNSKDAVPRTMQKIVGGYPSDLPYKNS